MPYRLPEKQFLSLNTFAQSYDYTMTLIKREKRLTLSFLLNWYGRYLYIVEFPSPKEALRRWVEIGPLVPYLKIFKKFNQCILAISQLSPLGKGYGPLFEQCWIPLIQGCFVPSLVEIGLMVLKGKNFKFRQCAFAILLLSPIC